MPTVGSSGLRNLIAQLTQSQKKAQKANEERYAELLKNLDALALQVGKEGTFGEAMKLVENIGGAARQRIAEQTQKAVGASKQDLISRGLASSTVRGAQERGIRADEQRALQEQEEAEAQRKSGLLTQRAGLEMGLGQLKAGAMERRSDIGPDLGVLTSLIQSAAAGEEAGKRTTVRVPSAPPGPGIVTRHRAEQAASEAARQARAAGGGGAGGVGGRGGGAAYYPPGSYGGGGTQVPYLSGAINPALTPAAGPQPGTVYLGEQGIVSGVGFQGLPPAELAAAQTQPQPKPGQAISPARVQGMSDQEIEQWTGVAAPTGQKKETGGKTLTVEDKKKYTRWMGMGWGWMVPDWAKSQL